MFSKAEALRFGWLTAKSNVGFFFALFAISQLASGLPEIDELAGIPVPNNLQQVFRVAWLILVVVALWLGWSTVKSNASFVLVVLAFLGTVYVVSAISELYEMSRPVLIGLWASVGTGAIVFALAIPMGLIKIALTFYEKAVPRLSALLSCLRLIPSYLWGSIIYSLAVGIGFLFLIIPGVYIAVKYSLWVYLVVDKRMGGGAAFTEAGRVAEGSWWDPCVLYVVLACINVLGLLCLGLGLFLTIPTTMVAQAYAYRKLVAARSAQRPS